MKDIMTEEQYNCCLEEANKIAKILMEKDVSFLFNEDTGNCNYVLHTLSIINAGVILLASRQIDMDANYLLEVFCEKVKDYLNQEKPKNKYPYLVQ